VSGRADSFKIPTWDLRTNVFAVAPSTLNAGDAGLYMDDLVRIRRKMKNGTQSSSSNLTFRTVDLFPVGVDINTREWLGELHAEVDLESHRPYVGAAATHDGVISNDPER
jgi:hypothetical protein